VIETSKQHDDLLYAYAFVKSCADKGGDYLDLFVPLVLAVLCPHRDDKPLPLESVSAAIEKTFGLSVIDLSLQSILERACKTQRARKVGRHGYVCTDQGADLVSQCPKEADVRYRQQELLSDVRGFAIQRGNTSVDEEALERAFLALVQSNLRSMLGYAWKDPNALESVQPRAEAEQVLLDYLIQASETHSAFLSTIKDVINGSILSSVLRLSHITIAERRIRDLTLYCDSNFLFSLLGLHRDPVNRAAGQLAELLLSEGCSLRVFDFTIQQMVGVLNWAANSLDLFPPDLPIDGIAAQARRLGWRETDLRVLIANLEDELRKLNISIGPPLQPVPVSASLVEKLRRYKPDAPLASLQHDLQMIEQIRQRRRGGHRNLADVRFAVLSSDTRLANFNLKEMEHQSRSTIPEILTDTVLGGVLWMRNRDRASDLPLSQIIAANSSTLLIDRGLWLEILRQAEGLKDKGLISSRDLEILLYMIEMRRWRPEPDAGTSEAIGDEILAAIKTGRQEEALLRGTAAATQQATADHATRLAELHQEVSQVKAALAEWRKSEDADRFRAAEMLRTWKIQSASRLARRVRHATLALLSLLTLAALVVPPARLGFSGAVTMYEFITVVVAVLGSLFRVRGKKLPTRFLQWVEQLAYQHSLQKLDVRFRFLTVAERDPLNTRPRKDTEA